METKAAILGRLDRLVAVPCGSLVDHRMTSPALPGTWVLFTRFRPGLKKSKSAPRA
jgi:hypothetical protein